jgi:hypothetical protein
MVRSFDARFLLRFGCMLRQKSLQVLCVDYKPGSYAVSAAEVYWEGANRTGEAFLLCNLCNV